MDINIKFSLIIEKLNQKIAELNIKISEDEDNVLLKKELNTLLKDKELLYKGNSNEFKNILEKYGDMING